MLNNYPPDFDPEIDDPSDEIDETECDDFDDTLEQE